MALAGDAAAARTAAGQAVQVARQSGDPGALAAALGARQHVLWGTQNPGDALAGATEIVAAARTAGDPERELDGHVLRLTHLLECCDGPAARRELAQVCERAGPAPNGTSSSGSSRRRPGYTGAHAAWPQNPNGPG